jgi:MFS family permease
MPRIDRWRRDTPHLTADLHDSEGFAMTSSTDTRSARHWMWVAAFAIAALYIISTIPTPLYGIYRREFDFPELVVTEIYAIYVIGNLAVLLFFGRLSDQIGRKPAALIGLGVIFLANIFFFIATSTVFLLIARVLSGLAAGLGASALTAWIAELEPHHDRARGAVVASGANLAGLMSGALLAGILAVAMPWSLRSSYAVYAVLLAILIVLLLRAPETVEKRVRSFKGISLRPRIGVPKGIRLAFVAPAAMAFSAFALGGFYAALAPGILTQDLHQRSPLVTGCIVAGFFGTAAIVTVASQALRGQRAIVAALILLLSGLCVLVAAETMKSMPWLIAATAITGAAMGLGYRSSLQVINEIAPGERRAELVAAYLLVCYSANALPVIGVGLLTQWTGPAAAHYIFAGVLAALSSGACAIGLRYAPPG